MFLSSTETGNDLSFVLKYRSIDVTNIPPSDSTKIDCASGSLRYLRFYRFLIQNSSKSSVLSEIKSISYNIYLYWSGIGTPNGGGGGGGN